MAAPSLPVSAAALRHADLLFAKRETSDAAREAAYALLNDNGGTLEGGALLKKCLAAVVADPYGSLGIEPGADESAIKKAYRKLALKYHPDKNDKTTALFQAIKTAYDKLLEPGGAKAAAKAWEKRKAACADARRERATARFERTHARQRGFGGGGVARGGHAHFVPPHRQQRPAPPDRRAAEQRAEERGAELRQAKAAAAAVERHRRLREKKAELDRKRAAHAERCRAERLARGAKLNAERARAEAMLRAQRLEREAEEAAARLREEAARRAAKHSSMFDDLMAGMAAKKRHGRRAASPPIALRATDVTASTVDLAWEHAEADRSFEFQWRKRDAGVWVMASVQQALCRKKNLEPNTPYAFRVRVAANGDAAASDWSREVVVVTTVAPATTALFSPPPRKPRAAAVHPEDDDDGFDASPSKLKRAASEFMKRMDQGARLFGSKPPSLFNSRSDKRVGVAPKRAPRKFPKPKSAPPRGWYELKDDQGAVYYWNSATDESQWEPPSSWAEEVDPASGVRYYTDGMHSTWRKPADFVDFVRHVDNRRAPGYRDWAKATTRAKRPV